MNDPKALIDGLFNSMIGDEPEAAQPETADGLAEVHTTCPVCSEVFLAGTANEDGWCEDCEGNWPPEHQEPSDTVGAPILKTVAEMDDVAGCLVDSDQYRAFAAACPELAEKSRLARQEVSDWNERRAQEAVARQVGGSKHDPNTSQPDFQVEAYQAAHPGAVVVDKTHAYESPAPDQRYGTAEAEVARDAEANRAAMEEYAASVGSSDMEKWPSTAVLPEPVFDDQDDCQEVYGQAEVEETPEATTFGAQEPGAFVKSKQGRVRFVVSQGGRTRVLRIDREGKWSRAYVPSDDLCFPADRESDERLKWLDPSFLAGLREGEAKAIGFDLLARLVPGSALGDLTPERALERSKEFLAGSTVQAPDLTPEPTPATVGADPVGTWRTARQQVAELTQRVETLESRLDSLLNGFANAIHPLR